MAEIKIVYGTGGGNTEIVCQRVEEVLVAKGHEVSLLKAKVSEPEDIGSFDLLILASPTYGHGQLEKYFGVFLSKLEKVDLKGRLAAIIGLGDPKYDSDYHIESAKVMMDFFKRKEAELVYMPCRVSRCPLKLLDNYVTMWAEKLSEKLGEALAAKSGESE